MLRERKALKGAAHPIMTLAPMRRGQTTAVEVPVERVVQYDAPREGNFQVTSGWV